MLDYLHLTPEMEKLVFQKTVYENPYIPKDHLPYPKQIQALLDFRKELLYGGAAGGGKALTLSTKIVTPFGTKFNGDLKIGDQISNPDGSIQHVINIYDMEYQDIYRVTFIDGSYVDATLDHIWYVITSSSNAMLQTTKELINYINICKIQELHGIKPIWPHIPPFNEYHSRIMVDIRKIGRDKCRCIKVSNPNGLYVVNDYIITHNSDYLLMAALQFVTVPGYNSIIFRRSYTDLSLPDGLIPRSHEWLTNTDARWRPDLHQWVFPSGATMTFGYLESENDVYRYKSAQFQFCVAKGTKVLSENNKYINIEDIKENDLVMTLEGLKRVTKVWGARTDECIKTETFNKCGKKMGEQIHPITHEILTLFGWQSYASIYNLFDIVTSKQFHTSHTPSLQEGRKCQYLSQTSECLRERMQQHEPSQSHQDHQLNEEQIVCSRDAQTYNTEISHEDLETPQLPSLCVPVVLHVPDPLLHTDQNEDYDRSYAQMKTLSANYQSNCSSCCDLYDAQFQFHSNIFLDDLPSLYDAEEHIQSCYNWGDKAYILKHAHPHLISYAHPYTKDIRNSSEVVQLGSCKFTPVGKHVVYDISVEDVSHYITSSLLVNKNCGYEELTEFPTERFYTYLFSRMRKLKSADVPMRMRCTTNPDGPGADWVFERFKPTNPQPISEDRNFIQAKLDDNIHIDREGYEANLEELDPVTRMQLRNGVWKVKKSGNKFKQEWFDRSFIDMNDLPTDGIVVRYWDLAATEEKKKGSRTTDPDWTVGARVRLYKNIYYIEDIRRGRFNPGKLEDFIAETAELDGPEVIIFIEQEPGATGKMVVDDYIRRVLSGYPCFGDRPTGNKEMRANIFSAALYNKNVRIVRADWNKQMVTECLLFPTKGVHDDVCFAEGTKITTIHGDKNIEDIKIGDVVIVPGGTSKVTQCGITGIRDVMEKIGLVGTPNHKIFNGKEFISLESHDVSEGVDTICVKNQIRWISRKLWYGMEQNTDSWERKDIILASIPQMRNEEPLLKVCMWPFMSFIREKKYRKAMSYIIKMVIHSIIQLKILSVWNLNNTLNSLNHKIHSKWQNISTKCVNLLKNGIDLKKDEHGTENMQRDQESTNSHAPALCVENHLNLQNLPQNIVTIDVTSARDGSNEKKMDIMRRGRQIVYNLTTEPSHVFYANGVLVSNCDAISGAMGRLPRAKRWKSGDIGEVSAETSIDGFAELQIEKIGLDEVC